MLKQELEILKRTIEDHLRKAHYKEFSLTQSARLFKDFEALVEIYNKYEKLLPKDEKPEVKSGKHK